MAHAASQLKKNRGEVDVNALEDEKEKRKKIRRAASREQKRKVTDEGWLVASSAPLAALERDCVCVCVCVTSPSASLPTSTELRGCLVTQTYIRVRFSICV